MKKFFWLLLIFLSFVGCSDSKQDCDRVDPDVQVGIYDSRSIAVAFMSSDVYNKTEGLVLKEWMEEYKIAKNENDQQKIKDLESKGQSQQEKLHLQGFGTAPVDDILAYIPEEINNLKQQNNIQLLISK